MALAAAATDAAAVGICIVHKTGCNNVTGHLAKNGSHQATKALEIMAALGGISQQCLLSGGAPRPPLTVSFRPHQCFSLFKDTH